MVEPEPHQLLLELVRPIDGLQQFGLLRLLLQLVAHVLQILFRGDLIGAVRHRFDVLLGGVQLHQQLLWRRGDGLVAVEQRRDGWRQ